MGLFSFKINKGQEKNDLKDVSKIKSEILETEKYGKIKSPKTPDNLVQPVTSKKPDGRDKKIVDARISLKKDKLEKKLNSGITIDDNSSAIQNKKNLPQQTLIKSKTKIEEIIHDDKKPDNKLSKGNF